jgi:hypothetical protein
MKVNLTFIILIIIPISLFARLPETVFKELWGSHFHLRKTENGEILSISSVFYQDNTIYLYDMAERKIVSLDTNFSFIKETPLATVGRNTYVGDDFVIRNNEIIFLNTVDKLLEIFDLKTGKHKRSVKYPCDYFSEEPKRRYRIINKIFLDNECIVIGNSHKLFYFDLIKKEVVKGKEPVSVKKDHKFLMYNRTQTVTKTRDYIYFNSRKYKPIHNSFLISGKQYFIMKNSLYAFSLDNTRICIIKVEEITD